MRGSSPKEARDHLFPVSYTHLNLEENATRRHLLAEALLQLPEERRAQVLEAAEAAGVPDGHHHDLGEVNATIDALDASERAKDDMRAVYRLSLIHICAEPTLAIR